MGEVTRRTFMKQVSAGAAGVAAITAMGVPQAVAATSRSRISPHSAPSESAASSEPIVAYVRDGKRGEVTIMRGHEEIVRRDPDLVRRILSASR